MQEISRICKLLCRTKHQFDSCLCHISEHQFDLEISSNTLPQSYRDMQGLIHKAYHFLFGRGKDSVPANKIKQEIHALNENQQVQS